MASILIIYYGYGLATTARCLPPARRDRLYLAAETIAQQPSGVVSASKT